MNLKNHLSKFTLLPLGLVLATVAQTAQAEPTGYDQISFDAEASQSVENDEVSATLYKELQAKTPKQLAVELNTTLNSALAVAKKYPAVTATTGSQSTYPKYDDDRNIVGWTGRASIELNSKDFSATSELVAALQDDLVLQDIRFGVSDDKQTMIKSKLMQQASKNFKSQAEALTRTWGASGYRVVKVSLNGQGGYHPYPMPVVVSARAMDASAPPQNFEGGDTVMSVTAQGTIELVK